MKDTQILSAFHGGGHPGPLGAHHHFDACHAGVVLRAVLLVEVVLAVAALFWAFTFRDWLSDLALLTGAALPATLTWLACSCLLRRLVPSLPRAWLQIAEVLLGALSGLGGCALLVFAQLLPKPPWLACAASGALLAFALAAHLSLRERGKMPAATTARLAELQSRIRPHFLFNTLNSAMALLRAEPARAEALLQDLSDLFRHALAEQAESVNLADEIALAQRYLAIEQVRFGQRLQVTWTLDPAADAARLPPLLLQPLLENAVRHGVEPSVDGAQIQVSTERRGDRVMVRITNTVPAGPGEAGQGVALDNVRARLALLYDVHSEFRAGLRDGWFVVQIEVPL